jgi:NADP-dependent 3-hydroxy acid dehydrogenase YdfG
MKLAVITGASSGIGAATARVLGREGYRVVLVARNRPALDELAAEIGGRAVVEALDASDGDAVVTMAARVSETLGIPDLIVNSAGAGAWDWIEDTSPAEAVTMMQAPYFAAFNMTHAFMGGMLARGSGVLIHVNSPVSFATWPGCTGYAAARWALRGLHEALCDDLWKTGVRSCHVVFGEVASPYFERNRGARERVPGIARTIRTLTPEECAGVIARVARRPRRQVVHPFLLRLYSWSHAIYPWGTRFLLRRTGAKRSA